MDRTKASEMGLTARDVASSLLLSLSGSSQAQPAYWLNPKNGVQYLVNARVPQTELDSLEALGSHPGRREPRRRGGRTAAREHRDDQPVHGPAGLLAP